MIATLAMGPLGRVLLKELSLLGNNSLGGCNSECIIESVHEKNLQALMINPKFYRIFRVYGFLGSNCTIFKLDIYFELKIIINLDFSFNF